MPTIEAMPQLSVAVAGPGLSMAPQTPGALSTVDIFAGQVITGGVVSTTVTVNEQLPWLPDASVAAQVTVVVPKGKFVPDGGEHVAALTPGQLSVAAAVYEVLAVQFAPAVRLLLAGQVTTGF